MSNPSLSNAIDYLTSILDPRMEVLEVTPEGQIMWMYTNKDLQPGDEVYSNFRIATDPEIFIYRTLHYLRFYREIL